MKDPKPVTRIEVTEGNKKLRVVLIVVLLAVGLGALTSGFMSLLGKDAGWQSVEVSTDQDHCGTSFQLQYNFSGTGAQATALHKKLSALYSDGLVRAYEAFYTQPEQINTHVNEEVTVDPLLYSALEALEGTRYHYLAPLYAYYDGLIFNTDDANLAQADPRLSREAQAYVSRLAELAGDETAVELELLGENRVMLRVSQEYLAFAQENEITRFVDLHYLTNAFIIDYLADTLAEQGYTRGYLVSMDGYTRNLDSTQSYSLNLFDRGADGVQPVGVMEYTGPVSLVTLRDFPVTGSDISYRGSGEHIIFPYTDPADGMYKASTHSLVGYSYELGCADVLLRMLPAFVSEEFSVPEEIYSVFCQDNTLCYNDPAVAIGLLEAQGSPAYTLKQIQ